MKRVPQKRRALGLLGVMTVSVGVVGGPCGPYHWSPDPPIDVSGMRIWPEGEDGFITSLCGAPVGMWCNRAIDYDTRTPHDPNSGGPTEILDQMADDPNHSPNWTCTAGGFTDGIHTGEHVRWIAPDSAQVAVVSAHDDDLPSQIGAEDTGTRDDSPDKVDKVVVCLIPEVTAVGFPLAVSMYRTPTEYGGWGDGTDGIPFPEYDATLGRNEFCCHAGGTTVWVGGVECRVSEPLTLSTIITLGAGGTCQFSDGTTMWEPGTIETYGTSEHVAATPLEKKVEVYDETFVCGWSYKVPEGSGNWISMNITAHKMYVTYGEPYGSSVTLKRIAWVCDEAIALDDPNQIADAIHEELHGYYDLTSEEVWGPSPIWRLHLEDPNDASQCPGLALYVQKHFQMIGLTNCDLKFCYAMPGGTATEADAPESVPWAPTRHPTQTPGHPNPTVHDDVFGLLLGEALFMIDSHNSVNKYEAACRFNGKYYIPDAPHVYSSPAHVVYDTFAEIDWHWVYPTFSPLDPNIFLEDNFITGAWRTYWRPCADVPYPRDSLWPDYPNNP